MKENNKIYTAADFARYHAGTMPADEMHALEKAALEDPFLEDALEGYAYTPAAENDIEELRGRLAEKTKRKNVFFLPSFAQNKWWRIAAFFLFVAGGGYLFYRINSVSENPSIAKNEVKIPAAKKDSVVPSADSAHTNNGIAFENVEAAKLSPKEKAVLPEANLQREKRIEAPLQQAETAHMPTADNDLKEDFYSDSTRFNKEYKETVPAVKEYVLKGTVTDDKGNAVPYASISARGRKIATLTDTSGRFLLRSRDSSITAFASAVGYASKSFLLKKDVQPTIAMNKSDAALEEVVVTAYSVKRRRSKKPASESKALEGKVAGVQIAQAPLQRSGGQEKFDGYLQKNITPVYDENNERDSGEVVLSFTINKKGRPKNIKVIKSSCEACEDEAIKLLENGPVWTGSKNSPGTVVIKF